METLTTTTAAEAWRPNVVSAFNADDMLRESLLTQCATRAGEVEGDAPAVLVPYVSSDPTAGFTPEGVEITPDDVVADEVRITTNKVTVLSKVSREQVAQRGAAERIAQSLKRSITAKADAAFLTSTTGPTGLLAMSGIATAGDLGGATENNLFAVYDAAAAIEADGGQATHLLINPIDWAKLARIPQATGSNVSVLAGPHDAAQRQLGGVPVIVHAAVTQGSALMLDRSEVVAAYGTMNLARSDDVFFTSDSVGIRATWRIGWDVIRPARLQLLTIGAE